MIKELAKEQENGRGENDETERETRREDNRWSRITERGEGVRHKEAHVDIHTSHFPMYVYKEANGWLQMNSHFARVEERLLVEFLSALQNLLL